MFGQRGAAQRLLVRRIHARRSRAPDSCTTAAARLALRAARLLDALEVFAAGVGAALANAFGD